MQHCCKNNLKIFYLFCTLYCALLYICVNKTQNDTFNPLPEVPISAIWEHLTARREQYTKPERPSLIA